MRAHDKEVCGNEKPVCINIISQLRALLHCVDLMHCAPKSSWVATAGGQTHPQPDLSSPCIGLHECKLSLPLDFRAPQRPVQALWKWNEQIWDLCLKYNLDIPNGTYWGTLTWLWATWPKPSPRVPSLLWYFVLRWSNKIFSFSFERIIKEAGRDGRHNQHL